MDLFLQIWGGAGYLAAKILLSHAEGIKNDRAWRIAGWLSYVIGVPAWVILLAGKHDWLAAANEAGGAPALILGLVLAWKGREKAHPAVDLAVRIFTYLMIALGAGYSLYVFHGITAFTQVLEIGVTVGFLLGSYLLAKKKAAGWLLFMLMLTSTATLMFIQGKPVLVIQQTISLVFVINGFVRAVRAKADPAK
jgi:hypothetical protein